jgi:hypothetical protein
LNIFIEVVDEVEFVFERIDTWPTSVVADWTLNPVPIFTLPLTPKPPRIVNAPVVEDVVFALDKIDTAPINVDAD